MNNTLSKAKNSNPHAYKYRGLDVLVTRSYSFNGDYCTGSMYHSPKYKIYSHNIKKFKTMMDNRIFKECK